MKSFQQWVGLDLKLHEDAVTEQLLLPPPLAQTPHSTLLLDSEFSKPETNKVIRKSKRLSKTERALQEWSQACLPLRAHPAFKFCRT